MTTPLHAVDQRHGETVLLLHSGGMSSRQSRKLTELLTPSYRVIAPDFLAQHLASTPR